MGDEKQEGVLECNAHRFVLGGQAAAVLSILFLVPVVRRLREQQQRKHRKHRRHFPVLGH